MHAGMCIELMYLCFCFLQVSVPALHCREMCARLSPMQGLLSWLRSLADVSIYVYGIGHSLSGACFNTTFRKLKLSHLWLLQNYWLALPHVPSHSFLLHSEFCEHFWFLTYSISTWSRIYFS